MPPAATTEEKKAKHREAQSRYYSKKKRLREGEAAASVLRVEVRWASRADVFVIPEFADFEYLALFAAETFGVTEQVAVRMYHPQGRGWSVAAPCVKVQPLIGGIDYVVITPTGAGSGGRRTMESCDQCLAVGELCIPTTDDALCVHCVVQRCACTWSGSPQCIEQPRELPPDSVQSSAAMVIPPPPLVCPLFPGDPHYVSICPSTSSPRVIWAVHRKVISERPRKKRGLRVPAGAVDLQQASSAMAREEGVHRHTADAMGEGPRHQYNVLHGDDMADPVGPHDSVVDEATSALNAALASAQALNPLPDGSNSFYTVNYLVTFVIDGQFETRMVDGSLLPLNARLAILHTRRPTAVPPPASALPDIQEQRTGGLNARRLAIYRLEKQLPEGWTPLPPWMCNERPTPSAPLDVVTKWSNEMPGSSAVLGWDASIASEIAAAASSAASAMSKVEGSAPDGSSRAGGGRMVRGRGKGGHAASVAGAAPMASDPSIGMSSGPTGGAPDEDAGGEVDLAVSNG